MSIFCEPSMLGWMRKVAFMLLLVVFGCHWNSADRGRDEHARAIIADLEQRGLHPAVTDGCGPCPSGQLCPAGGWGARCEAPCRTAADCSDHQSCNGSCLLTSPSCKTISDAALFACH
jgi:hypothetical protein